MFFVLAALALATAVLAALVRRPRSLARLRLAHGLALAGLLAVIGAGALAVLAAVSAVLGVRIRLDSPSGVGRSPSDENASPVAGSSAGESLGVRRWALGMAALMVAFFSLLLRATLIARWPRAVVDPSSVGALSCWILGLALCAIGLYATLTAKRAVGLWLGIEGMTRAVAFLLAAVWALGAGGAAVAWLAAGALIAPILTALAVRETLAGVDAATDATVAARVSTSLGTVVVGVTLALLAGAW